MSKHSSEAAALDRTSRYEHTGWFGWYEVAAEPAACQRA